MTGARFIHDQLELAGWDVLIADAQLFGCATPLFETGVGDVDAHCEPSRNVTGSNVKERHHAGPRLSS
jgi:hypothetical protein